MALAAGAIPASAGTLGAQSDYHGIDAGRPLRFEDAKPVERHALELGLASVRAERIVGGYYRWQVEPRLSYGALPRTELSLRAPVAHREKGAEPRGGLVGIGAGVFHALNIETSRLPAFAIEVEALIPANGSPTYGTTYAIRGVATRTLAVGRVHLNAGYGTYKLRLPSPNFPLLPAIPDTPCSLQHESNGGRADASASVSACGSLPHQPPQRSGARWLAGAAVDKAFPLRSTMVIAGVLAERFAGIGRPVEWTAELGARHQLSPRLVVDAGLGHRFTGVSRTWSATAGLTMSVAARAFVREAR